MPQRFNVNDLVDVRAKATHTWRPGMVASVTPLSSGERYQVSLDTPIATSAWLGFARAFGGDGNISSAIVFLRIDTVKPDELIRAHI